MIVLDYNTGNTILDNFNRNGYDDHTSLTAEEYKLVKQTTDATIILHSHSENGRPSGQDITVLAIDPNIKLSLVICHDGTIYAISNVKRQAFDIYQDALQLEKRRWTNEKIAKKFAANYLYQKNKEAGNRHKLFKVEEL